MRSVDTNVLVRFLTRDDIRQFEVAKSVLSQGDVWIAKTVLLETEWVLRSRYRYPADQVLEAFRDVLGLPGLMVEDPAAVTDALDLFAEGLDFADALHLASRPAGARFVTFDDSLVRRAKRAHVTGIVNPVR